MRYTYSIICTFNAEVLSNNLQEFIAKMNSILASFGVDNTLGVNAEKVELATLTINKKLTAQDKGVVRSILEDLFKESKYTWNLVVNDIVLKSVKELD